MDENYRTRISHQPDWLIDGLVKSAVFADESRDEPMFKTEVSWNQLKTQVQSLLVRSGLNLTKREIGVATYWLTERIAGYVSEQDTKETLTETMQNLVSQYIVDKSLQRTTGVSERGPIHTREWYDKNYGQAPGMDKDAAADDDDSGPELSDDSEPQVFVGIDGDNIGSLVEETLLTDDPEAASAISRSIHDAHDEIGDVVKERGGRLIFDGGDNMLFTLPLDIDTIEGIRRIYRDKTGHSATVGIGKRPIEAHFALVVGKNTGKDKIVVFGQEVLDEYEAIHEEQEEAAPLFQKLKYRASVSAGASGVEGVVDRAFWDLGVARVLRAVLGKLGLPVNDESVYDTFIRLVHAHGLDSVASIHRFFTMGFDALENAVRTVRGGPEPTVTAGVKFMALAAVPTSEPQHFPGQSVPPFGQTRKSPHPRKDWLTIEDYNKDQVDVSKTDVSYVGGNVPKDSQMMCGGDQGDPIYVP